MKGFKFKKVFWAFGVSLFILLLANFSGDPFKMNLSEQFRGPSWEHPFGQDQNGGDILAKIIYGARISLKVAIIVVSLSVAIGLLIGAAAGYWGGILDHLLMRGVDLLVAFPGFLLSIALVAVMGPSVNNLIFTLCITGWTSYARLVRGEILHLKERDYVKAAEALGASSLRILFTHLIPNLLGPLIVQATFGMAGTIVLESGLSFLGLGAPPNEPTWGSLLNSGRKVLFEAPHMSLFPAGIIVLMVLVFNLSAQKLQRHLDHRFR